jgi:hypothetical protein
LPRLHCSVTSTTQFQPTPVVVTKGERYASYKRATRCSCRRTETNRLCAGIWTNVHSTRVSERHLFPLAGRPNDTFSPEWPINWGPRCGNGAPRGDDGRSAETVLLALGAWKPAKDTGFHIPTATATAAVKSDKLLNPRKSHYFPDSCAEPQKDASEALSERD